MISKFLTYLVSDLKKIFKDVDLCICYPGILSPEILSKPSAFYVSATRIKKTELLATGDKKLIVEIVIYVRVITPSSEIENMAGTDLAANLLSYICNKKWVASNALMPQEVQAQDCYGISKDNASLILGTNSLLSLSGLTRAQALYDTSHMEGNVSLWAVSWDQPLQFNIS